MRNQYPSIVAALVGHALRQQMVYVQQNPSLNNQFKNLQQEARAYITDVARTTSNRGRNEDGSPLNPGESMVCGEQVLPGSGGCLDLPEFGVRTGRCRRFWLPGLGLNNRRRPFGGLPMRNQEETNQIRAVWHRGSTGKTART